MTQSISVLHSWVCREELTTKMSFFTNLGQQMEVKLGGVLCESVMCALYGYLNVCVYKCACKCVCLSCVPRSAWWRDTHVPGVAVISPLLRHQWALLSISATEHYPNYHFYTDHLLPCVSSFRTILLKILESSRKWLIIIFLNILSFHYVVESSVHVSLPKLFL